MAPRQPGPAEASRLVLTMHHGRMTMQGGEAPVAPVGSAPPPSQEPGYTALRPAWLCIAAPLLSPRSAVARSAQNPVVRRVPLGPAQAQRPLVIHREILGRPALLAEGRVPPIASAQPSPPGGAPSEGVGPDSATVAPAPALCLVLGAPGPVCGGAAVHAGASHAAAPPDLKPRAAHRSGTGPSGSAASAA